MKNLVIRKAIGEDLSNIMEIKKQVHDLYIEKRPDIYKKMRFYTRKHFWIVSFISTSCTLSLWVKAFILPHIFVGWLNSTVVRFIAINQFSEGLNLKELTIWIFELFTSSDTVGISSLFGAIKSPSINQNSGTSLPSIL